MPFIPHTEEEVSEMLATINVTSIDELFSEIPSALQINSPLNIASGMNEMQATQLLKKRANENVLLSNYIGAGCYEHYIPACVWELTSRGEFMTAYTPYQAEASQGNLQLMWEYQSMMASLMGLSVSNASLYDGATALAEAILMALRTRRKATTHIWVPMNLHPQYRAVLSTILKPQQIQIHEIPYQLNEGTISLSDLEEILKKFPCDVLVISQPNFFGGIEAVDALTNWAHRHEATVVGVVNPIAMNLLKPPGEWGEKGAQIACGEGQPLGVPMNYGGPYFGFLCCQKDLVRQMPGRIVGKTVDLSGKEGFTLTLQAREQHIRRGKATSNICTNQGLLVTAATIYMSVMGPSGLKNVAQQSHAKANTLYQKLLTIPGVTSVFSSEKFHEFVVRLPVSVKAVLAKMRLAGIQAGVDLSEYYPELDNTLLVCVTEMKTPEQLESYFLALSEACRLG